MSRRTTLLALALAFTAACDGDGSTGNTGAFLDGTAENAEIGLVVNSTGRALTMFQLGDPDEQRAIELGTSAQVTPTSLALRGTRALVPLGNTASVALIDLETEQVARTFTFPSGNTTGAAWVDDNTFLVANLIGDYVGKATLGQSSAEIASIVEVAPAPTAIVMHDARAFVVSGNLDESFMPIDSGIVTVIDPATMMVVDDIEMGGTNSSAAAVGPDGKLYVLNTGDYVGEATMTIVDPVTREVETTVEGFPAGAGAVRIDEDGLAYVSSASSGTAVWNTVTRTFVRDAANPVCVGSPCLGAFDADRAEDGSLYQAFFGGGSNTPYVYVYAPDTYELVDSISAGVGLTSIEIARFREP